MKNALTSMVLGSMTRDELRAVATRFDVPRGRNRTDTIANLASAIEQGKCRISVMASIKTPQANGAFGQTVFMKKIRSDKQPKTVMAIS